MDELFVRIICFFAGFASGSFMTREYITKHTKNIDISQYKIYASAALIFIYIFMLGSEIFVNGYKISFAAHAVIGAVIGGIFALPKISIWRKN